MRLGSAALLWLLLVPAQAQEAAQLHTAPEEPSKILMVGDALAQGVSRGLEPLVAEKPGFILSGRFQEDSGLVRRDVYDWTLALPKILARDPADIIIMMAGANDVQTLEVNPVLHLFGSEGWKEAYRDRLRDFVLATRSSGATLYWIGPPPMGDPAYSQNIAMIATVQAQTLQELGVPYIDLQKAMASPEGPILGAGPGDTVPIRNRDGVKFLREGDRRLAGLVFARIEAEIASAGPASKNATLQQPAKPELENAPAPSPLFGQAAAPEIVNVVTAKAEQVAPAVAVPRSVQTAERVFINGLMPAAPKGRFDDFSVAAPEAPAR